MAVTKLLSDCNTVLEILDWYFLIVHVSGCLHAWDMLAKLEERYDKFLLFMLKQST